MKQTSDITFAPDWLALREPADHAARDKDLLARAAACVDAESAVLDLACGTGSTIRAFSMAGYSDLTWRLYDHDAALLNIAAHAHPSADGIVGDLNDIANIALDDLGLVTASALLDLMSQAWVETLAKRLRAACVPFYAALNYNGVMRWNPPHADDDTVTALFNAHQQRDKGMGVALGPTSGHEAARIFEEQGFDVTIASSPWKVEPDQAALHEQLLAGIVDAVAEMDFNAAENWHGIRIDALKKSQALIGHTDILAIPQADTANFD